MTTEAHDQFYLSLGGHQLTCSRRGLGPPVVLIHGIPTFSYLWRNVEPALVDAGFEVTTFDLLGYGASDKPSETDLGVASQAQFVTLALDELNWQGGTIVGHNIGGGVAQLIAIENLQLVGGLELVDSITYDSFPEPGIARLKDPVWDGILGAPNFDLKKGLTKGFTRGMVHTERITPDLIEAYERPFSGIEGRLAYLRAARALRTEELASRMAEVERLGTQTLIVWGSEDAFQPLSYGARLADAMPNAQFEVIEQAGHFLPEDAPEALTQLMVNFVKRWYKEAI